MINSSANTPKAKLLLYYKKRNFLYTKKTISCHSYLITKLQKNNNTSNSKVVCMHFFFEIDLLNQIIKSKIVTAHLTSVL